MPPVPLAEGGWPQGYPTPETLRANGWDPLPKGALPFRSIVIASTNDHSASLEAVTLMAGEWGSELANLGEVGHLNPASHLRMAPGRGLHSPMG